MSDRGLLTPNDDTNVKVVFEMTAITPITDHNNCKQNQTSAANQLYPPLRTDNDSDYERIQAKLNNADREELVNQKFIYGDDEYLKSCREEHVEFQFPLHVCIANGSSKCFRLLLRDGANLMSRDRNDSNILHTLILSCSLKTPQDEDIYLEILREILEVLTVDELNKLTVQVDRNGYRALELSVRLGTFGLFRQLVNHPGIMVESSLDAGMNTYSLYNISIYENFTDRKRNLRSPLRMMIYLTETRLHSFKKYNIYNLPIIKKWLWYKFVRTLPFILLWFIFRQVFYFVLANIDPSTLLHQLYCMKENGTQNDTEYSRILCSSNVHSRAAVKSTIRFAYFAYYSAAVMLTVDIVEFVICLCDKERRLAFSGLYIPESPYISHTKFYPVCQFILLALNASSVPIALNVSLLQVIDLLYYLKAFYLPLMIMGIMFMLEITPVFGQFAITLQKMIKSMLVFVIFLFCVKLSFAKFFSLVAKHYGFTDVLRNIYYLFRVEIGAQSFGDKPETVIMVVHMVYYFISSILLLNYLIAVMSSLATNTAEDRDTVQLLRRLETIYTAEERHGQWFWRLVYYIRGRSPICIDAKSSS